MMRIGHGYDVHRLVENRDLILGGVKIDYKKGLLGHSDADVLIHAIMDSLLGAAAIGDIGQLFPDNDDSYKGISSITLLEIVGNKINKAGFTVENIDSTIVAEKPKMKPHIDNMRKKISKALNIEIENINIKATTEEGLSFTGRGEGIAAHSVCLLK